MGNWKSYQANKIGRSDDSDEDDEDDDDDDSSFNRFSKKRTEEDTDEL